VEQLGALEKSNRRAAMAPNSYKETKEKETKETINNLLDVYENVDPDSEGGLKIGAVVGCLDSELAEEVVPEVRRKANVYDEVDYEPIVTDPETQETRGGVRWEISPENAAMAMKFMDSSMRWQSYTPPEWFKKIGKEKDGGEKQARIEYMVMVNNAAAGVLYAGKDLEKILGNKSAFGFTNEQMTKLFNEDFKMVTSKILNDFCEFYTDQNGVKCLRYKEKFYLLDKSEPDGFAKGADGKRKEVVDITRAKRSDYAQTIDEDVIKKIENIMSYKDTLADFLAKQNKRSKPDYMDQMNAYTAYNLAFAMGDMSIWDRMRILPTYEGVICDALRTLNPEYKALGKWQVWKGGKVRKESDLFSAEYFGGPVADWVLGVMKLERDLGRTEKGGKEVFESKPIDGRKTFKEKIIDGDMSFLANKTYYGFFDFVNGGRDLYKDPEGKERFWKGEDFSGEKVTLAELLMKYASFDKEGNAAKKGEEFNFGHKSVTFMNEFRDSLEGAILAYNCTMGKVDVKDPALWARNLKDKMGMVNGIQFNGKPPFKYARDPSFWRDAIIGSFGYDKRRISSDHPYVFRQPEKSGIYPSYNKYLYHMLADTFRLSNNDVNFNQLMRLLGVDVADGEDPNSVRVTIRNNRLETKEIGRSRNLIQQQRKKFKYT